MIYTISLSPLVKLAFPEETLQTRIDKTIEQLKVDPEISGMDTVIITAKDLSVPLKRNKFAAAMKNKHKDIDVICIYKKASEIKKLKDIEGLICKEVSKVTKDSIRDIVQDIANSKEIIVKESKVISKDAIAEPVQIEEVESTVLENEPLNIPEEIEEVEEVVIEEPEQPKHESIEERVRKCGEYADWEAFRKVSQKENVLRELIAENNKYAGVLNMLDVLDRKIATVFKDNNKSAEDKFEQIKQFALERTAFKDTQNNIIAEKVASVMVAITASAEATVDRRVKEISKSLQSFLEQSTVYYKKDADEVRELMDKRFEIQIELQETIKSVIETYQAMDATVAQVIEDFDKDLPSENAYINQVYKSSASLFVPENASKIASKLLGDLQRNKVSFARLENSLNETIALLFKLLDADNTVIEQQQKMIKLLEANRVEDAVIIDNMLKNCLRLYIGPNENGTRATAITWAGISSRRHNTLLIDLTGQSKFREYGIEPVKLNDFMNERIEQQFLCVEGNIGEDIEYLREVIVTLKRRLNYYPYIDIILNSDQSTIISELSSAALSATFISDCSNRSNKLVKKAMGDLKLNNIARKLVLIDSPVDALDMVVDITGDPLTTKLINIPHLTKMKYYSNKHLAPYSDRTIREIFEEAFR